MCFRWLKRLYHYLRRKWSRRNRGYSREISLSHHGFCSGAFTNRHGRASFSCGRDSSVTYSRRPSSCPPLPAPAPYSISGRFSCDTDGSLVVSSGDCGVTSSWDPVVRTVPVYGSGMGMEYGGEDVGSVISSAGGGGGSVYHGGSSRVVEGAGAGYGYSAPLSDTLSTGGLSEGSGYYGGGYGYGTYGTYGTGMLPGPEISPVGTGCAQVVQQKCPVVIPTIKSEQCKQSTHWPPIQKK
nr:keratin, type II cytoskeletal 2 oral-like [Zonotrichia albicollis]